MPAFDDEIISGSVFRSIWKIAWPVIITQVVAGIHGIVDHILVGKYVGIEGQAAIGASWQLFLVVVVFLSSLFHGMNIFIARYAGRQDRDAVNRIWSNVMITSLYIHLFVIAPLGLLLAPSMLSMINTHPDVMFHATPYLRILFTCSVPLFLMFILNWALQASGNPKVPMFLGVFTTAVNVLISYVLITGAGPFPELGASGAAIGTVVGPIPSVLIGLWLIFNHRVILGPPKKWSWRPDFSVIRDVARIGIPSGIQAVVLNIAGVALIFFINQIPHSTGALAAYTVCYTQLFSVVTWTGFGLRAACATVMGQNIGAGKPERGKRAVYLGAGIGFVWAAFFGIWYWLIPETLLGWFSLGEDPVVSEMAIDLLRFLTFSGVFVAVALAFTGGLQGAGDTKKPMFIAIITQIVIVLGICMVFTQLDRLTTTVIWASILTGHSARLALSYIVFVRGKWSAIKVELEEETDDRAPVLSANADKAADAVPEA